MEDQLTGRTLGGYGIVRRLGRGGHRVQRFASVDSVTGRKTRHKGIPITRVTSRLIGIVAFAVVWCSLLLVAAERPAEVETFGAAARGFGYVRVTARFYRQPGTCSSWTTFAAEDGRRAVVCASKRLADLLGFGDLKPVAEPELPGTVLRLDGAGLWLLGTEGANFHELFARDMPAMVRLIELAQATAWHEVPTRAYPRWLDCFDNAGPGIWYGGGGAPVDITTEFPWMQKRGLAYCFMPPTETRYVAPGVLDTTITDWFSAKCKAFDIPWRTLVWERKPSWLWNREPLPYVRRAPGTLPQNLWAGGVSLYYSFYGSEPVSASDPYTHDFRRRFAASLAHDPNVLGSMGVSEIGRTGVRVLTQVAGMPETKAYWHSYLVHELGLDLPRVGLLHEGHRDFYQRWDQVEVPTPRDFLGLDAGSVDLTGMWEGLADRDMKGLAAKWYAAETMPKEGWTPVHCNDPMLLLYIGGRHSREKRADYWLRRTVTLTAAQLPRLKYLHVERPGIRGKYCDAYVNGRPLKQLTRDEPGDLTVCFAVGDALRAGDNQLVLRMEGRPPIGTIALGPLPLRKYPYMSESENRRWFDATNFSAWLKMRGVEQTLRAMRTADPNRPLKLMSTKTMLDMSTELCERYGAYQHDTGGAAGYWCPMTGGRLARSHGLPWSCEPGGPPDNVAEIRQFLTFYVMLGNDAADMVFATTHYKDNPKVAAWFDENLELFRCLGKMHLPSPPIGVLRSSRADRLGFSEVWNWDIARGALQGVGRNFAYIEVPDILNGTMDRFPVVFDCGTVLLTEDEIEGIRRYVERGGIFVAQHHTGRHSPEKGDSWPLAKSLGLTVTPKWMSDENFNHWALAKIRFADDQALLPSLRGKTIEGSGVAIDYLGNEHSGAVAYTGDASDDRIRPIATWPEDGSMAIVEARIGRGRLILLGTPFYTRMRDENGVWVNDEDRGKLLDEFLTALGVPRDSWTGNREVWAERWRSKNGVYDLYPVARMNRKGDEALTAQVRIRRRTPLREVVEISALGHPRVHVEWHDGTFTLPATDYGPMQSRVYVAPRAEIARSALDWFQVQSRIWRLLPPLPPLGRPEPIPVPEDVIPAAEGWRMALGQADAGWTQAGFNDADWKTVKLGAFAALGVATDATARFRKEIAIPSAWHGRKVYLHFDAQWSYGVSSQGRLWIDGEPAAVRQPLRVSGDSSFRLDVTEQARDGKLTLALEVDGKLPDPAKPRARPAGVTGIFYLQSVAPPVATTPLAGPWFAAKDVNDLTPTAVGKKATYTYLETRFALPRDWPAKRVFLEAPVKLQWIILNNQIIQVPMQTLDISGLVRRDDENVLRWIPDYVRVPDITVEHTRQVPKLKLVWKD